MHLILARSTGAATNVVTDHAAAFLVLLLLLLLPLLPPASAASSAPEEPKQAVTHQQLGDLNIAIDAPVTYYRCSLDGLDLTDVYHPYLYYLAMRWAVEDVNARSDLLPNLTLGYLAYDSCNIDRVTLRYLTRYVEPPWPTYYPPELSRPVQVVAAACCYYSASSILASAYLQLLHLPLVSSMSTSDALTDRSRHPYFARVASPVSAQAALMMKFVRHFSWQLVGILHAADSYGDSFLAAFKQLADDAGVCVGLTAALASPASAASIDELEAELAAQPRLRVLVVVASDYVVAPVLARLASRNASKGGRFTFLLADAIVSLEAYKEVVVPSLYFRPVSTNVPQARFERGMSITVAEAMADPLSAAYLRYMFQCDRSKPDSAGCLAAANRSLLQSELPLTPKVANLNLLYDSVMAIAHGLHNHLADRCPEALAGNRSALEGCVNGPDLYQSILNSSFTASNRFGTPVQFQASGDPENFMLVVQDSVTSDGRYATEPLGVFSDGQELAVDPERLLWSKYPHKSQGRQVPQSTCADPCGPGQIQLAARPACCFDCRDCRSDEVVDADRQVCRACPVGTWPDAASRSVCEPVPPTRILPGDPVCLISGPAAGLNALLVVASFAYFVARRRAKIVKATSLPVSLAVLACLLAIDALALVHLALPTDATCRTVYYGFHLLYSGLFGLLLNRALRIYRLFRAADSLAKAKWASDACIFGGGLLLTAVQAGILAGLTVLMGAPQAVTRQLIRYEKEVEVICQMAPVQMLLPGAWNLLLIAGALVLAYLTRKLPNNFKESMCIFVCSFGTACLWLCYFPAYFFLPSGLQRAVVSMAGLLITAYACCACLFLPKIYACVRGDCDSGGGGGSGGQPPLGREFSTGLTSLARLPNLVAGSAGRVT